MIITITNDNGGIEKSVLAGNLAQLRAKGGRKVLLIDGDPRKAALGWCREHGADCATVSARAISGKGLQPELENLVPRYNDIVIDSEGRDSMGSRSALIAARTVVIPIKPHRWDAVDAEKLIARIERARLFNPALRVLFVLIAEKHAPIADELAAARSLVAKVTAATLANTVVHALSANDAVRDEGGDAWTQPYAVADMDRLYGELFEP